ncbi:MAG: sialidase family protein [Thermoplasmatota archaeon]
MHRLPAALGALAVALILAGCLSPSTTPSSIVTKAVPATHALPFTFSTLEGTDPASYGSEPSLGIDPKGDIWISAPAGLGGISHLWLSKDNGSTWKPVAYNPYGANGRGLGGGDTSIAIGKDGSVWITDLWSGSSTVTMSKDGGATWTTSPVGDEVPFNDREWNTVDAHGHGYYLGRTFSPAIAAWVARSDDGGQTWRHVGNPWVAAPGADDANQGHQDGGFITNPKTDAIGVTYSCGTNEVCVSTSTDEGVTWKPVVAAKASGSIANLFPTIAADTAGNWYVSYAVTGPTGKGMTIQVSCSHDGGKTWMAPMNVTTTPADRLMPAMVAGDDGRVAIAWYESASTASTNDLTAMQNAQWNVVMAVTTNAMAMPASFTLQNVTTAPIHKGTVSTEGFQPLSVVTGGSPDRGLGDFFTIAKDSRGMVHLAFVNGSRGGKFTTVHVAELGGISLNDPNGTRVPDAMAGMNMTEAVGDAQAILAPAESGVASP